MTATYEATWESVKTHPLPEWYDDAKLGVFLHWGLYSVPAWAPRVPDIQTILHRHGPRRMLRNNPYAEWYANTVQIPGSPTRLHHDRTYGQGFAYDGFAALFEKASSAADLDALAGLCRRAGARYVVLTTKHHEGYCLWPTGVHHPAKGAYHAPRDLVGDLTEAVRAQGLRMGLYYSGGYDWPYNAVVMKGLADVLLATPTDPGYARYADGHVRELIARYRPSVLWNDIGWPGSGHLPSLFAEYYNTVGDGVINDRWLQPARRGPLFDGAVRLVAGAVEVAWRGVPERYKELTFPGARHFDFSTPEYSQPDHVLTRKWEATRGVGHSFGANHNEPPEDIISTAELIHLLVDVVSKNGNLLIGVGPAPDGTVPDWQAAPLEGLGRWLEGRGEAVYGTRPWTTPADTTSGGHDVRFTRRQDALYATVFGLHAPATFTWPGLRAGNLREVEMVGDDVPVRWDVQAGSLSVTVPGGLPDGPAHVLRMAPLAELRPR